jgi:hypothetical protein
MTCLGEMQSPLEASVQELCNARLVEEFAHGRKRPSHPPDDFLSRSALERTSADIDPPPDPSRNDPADAPSVAVYYRDEAEVRNGFLTRCAQWGLPRSNNTPSRQRLPPRAQSREDARFSLPTADLHAFVCVR